jgi:SAM-dependent methyltransferase
MSNNATVRRERGSPLCLKDVQPPENFTVYNSDSHGEAHKWLANKFGAAAYSASEYVSPSDEPGSMQQSPFGMVRHEDLRALSFPSNSFDLVLSAEVFEHIPEPYKALNNEVFRVLKPGGFYVWTVPMNHNTHSKDIQLSMLNVAGQRFHAGARGRYRGVPDLRRGGAAAQDVRDRFCVHPRLLNVQREVRHRQPWRGHDHDRKKAADAIVAAGDPRTIHSLSGARCGGNAPLTLSTGKIPLIVCKGVRTSETTIKQTPCP